MFDFLVGTCEGQQKIRARHPELDEKGNLLLVDEDGYAVAMFKESEWKYAIQNQICTEGQGPERLLDDDGGDEDAD